MLLLPRVDAKDGCIRTANEPCRIAPLARIAWRVDFVDVDLALHLIGIVLEATGNKFRSSQLNSPPAAPNSWTK